MNTKQQHLINELKKSNPIVSLTEENMSPEAEKLLAELKKKILVEDCKYARSEIALRLGCVSSS